MIFLLFSLSFFLYHQGVEHVEVIMPWKKSNEAQEILIHSSLFQKKEKFKSKKEALDFV